jgi:hypothetical protein
MHSRAELVGRTKDGGDNWEKKDKTRNNTT